MPRKPQSPSVAAYHDSVYPSGGAKSTWRWPLNTSHFSLRYPESILSLRRVSHTKLHSAIVNFYCEVRPFVHSKAAYPSPFCPSSVLLKSSPSTPVLYIAYRKTRQTILQVPQSHSLVCAPSPAHLGLRLRRFRSCPSLAQSYVLEPAPETCNSNTTSSPQSQPLFQQFD